MRRIGILRETVSRFERRAPLTPRHVARLVGEHGIEVLVQPSAQRVFTDAEYAAAGAIVQEDVSSAVSLLGVKQVPLELVERHPGRCFAFFSHTIKGQEASMPLLDACNRSGVRLLDYECIRAAGGASAPRLVAFGDFAGKAGAIGALRGLGLRLAALGYETPLLSLRPTHEYDSYANACQALAEVGAALGAERALPPFAAPLTIAITGSTGKVGRGALDALRHLGDRALAVVEPTELASIAARGADGYKGGPSIFVAALSAADVVAPLDRTASFTKEEYYARPELFAPTFHERLLPHISLLINAAYWDLRFPRLLTAQQLAANAAAARAQGHSVPRLQMIADLSCDINGALEPLVRSTTIDDPFFVYDFVTATERRRDGAGVAALGGDGVAVLGTDILPAELPREASEHFGDALFRFVPQLADRATASRTYLDQLDTSAVGGPAGLSRELWSAIIACDGELTPRYRYISKIREARARLGRQHATHGAGQTAASVARVSLHGHLFDSGLINTALDMIEHAGGHSELLEVNAGLGVHGKTSAVIAIELGEAADHDGDGQSGEARLENLLDRLQQLARTRPAADASMIVLPKTTFSPAAPNMATPGGGGGVAAADAAAAGAPAGMTDRTAQVPAELAASARAAVAGSRAQRICVLGAGMCAGPAVELLSRDANTVVHVVSAERGAAAKLCAALGRPNAHPLEADAQLAPDGRGGDASVRELLARSDAVLSLLPARMHAPIARACIDSGVALVTASYVDDATRALAPAAAAAGVPVLCEMGLDPGLDHMSAMQLLDSVRARGGRILEFSSVCGGLPSPEVAAHTPLRYKFSWSPAGVLSALEQPAVMLQRGSRVTVGGGDELLAAAGPYRSGRLGDVYQVRRHVLCCAAAPVAPACGMRLTIPSLPLPCSHAQLEVLPNRDALQYVPLYGLDKAGELRAVFRGTLRFAGWAGEMAALRRRGLMDSNATVPSGARSWLDVARQLRLEEPTSGEDAADAARITELARELGLLDTKEAAELSGGDNGGSGRRHSLRDAFCALLARRLAYGEGERDLVLMEHHVLAHWPTDGRVESIVSTLALTGGGTAGMPSAMARTVGLTAAFGVRLLLSAEGRDRLGGGVHIPTSPAVYGAVLPLLAAEGVRFDAERCHTVALSSDASRRAAASAAACA